MTDSTGREAAAVFARSGLLAGLAIAPAAILMQSLGWPYSPPPLMVAAAVLIGVAAWLAGLALLRHPLFEEIRRLAAKLRRWL